MSVLVEYLPLGMKNVLPKFQEDKIELPNRNDMIRAAVAVGVFVANSYFGFYGILAVSTLSFPGASIALGSWALYRGVPTLIFALSKSSLEHFVAGLVFTAGAYHIMDKYTSWHLNGFKGFLEQR